jgi:hypothetical protein
MDSVLGLDLPEERSLAVVDGHGNGGGEILGKKAPGPEERRNRQDQSAHNPEKDPAA